jgi:hypothetical protein
MQGGGTAPKFHLSNVIHHDFHGASARIPAATAHNLCLPLIILGESCRSQRRLYGERSPK